MSVYLLCLCGFCVCYVLCVFGLCVCVVYLHSKLSNVKLFKFLNLKDDPEYERLAGRVAT